MCRQEIEKVISDLVSRFGYKPVPTDTEYGDVRQLYRNSLPEWCRENGDFCTLANSSGNIVCHGYERVVIGDYGAYIEFNRTQANSNLFCTAPGQEYRKRGRYAQNVKYLWLTTPDESGVKIYDQLRRVPYADYRPYHYYVSVYDVHQL